MSGVVLLNGFLLGLGLAVDAFLIALANGLNYPDLRRLMTVIIAALFSVFQIIMPMLGWLCIHTVSVEFAYFDEVLSWIAFAVMMLIGIKMIADGIKRRPLKQSEQAINIGAVIVQCFATSFDSLAVGFAIADYTLFSAFICSLIIASVTFVMFFAGFSLGKRCGMKFADKASIIGGIVFIGIGIEIFVTSFF